MPLNKNLTTTKRKGPHLAPGFSVLALISLALTVWAQERPAVAGTSRPDCTEDWVGTWSTALHEPDLGVPGLSNAGFNNQTLRQVVHTSVGGNRVRVRLSTFGAGALVIGAAHIARSVAGGAIEPGSDHPLAFGGKPSITIPPGALVVSDPVELESPALGDLAVTIYLPGNTGQATWHFESRQTSYVSTPGDFTASASMPVDSEPVAWFWLAGVDVMSSRGAGTIVTFGDSFTDGTHSTEDANHRWPDELARLLMAQSGNRHLGVLNEGLAGNRLLHDSLGPNALARFDRDVLAQTGVQYVIALIGSGDIVNPVDEVPAEEIIQGLKQLIERAHAKGLKIYGGTLPPNEGFLVPGTAVPAFTPVNEAKRQAVNNWIRTGGRYDGVMDFDAVLRDPSVSTRLLAAYDSGDHGHPNDEGYRKMAAAIHLKMFRENERH